MNSKKEYLKKSRLYAVTDLKGDEPEILTKMEQALRGGVDIIQLRAKTLSTASLLKIGRQMRELARRLDKLFIVNDRVDVMLALDADGVHLGQDDLPVDMARKMIQGKDKLIGCSTHNLGEAVRAEREGADYIGFGPIFETPTKPAYRPVGLELIPEVVKKLRVPVVFIGGIDRSNVVEVVKRGAKSVAVVRAVFAAPDPYERARELKQLLIPPHPALSP